MSNNKWIDHVKKCSKLLGISYTCALAMPEVKQSYNNNISIEDLVKLKNNNNKKKYVLL